MPTFTTVLLQTGNNVGIEVPPEVVEAEAAGTRARGVASVVDSLS